MISQQPKQLPLQDRSLCGIASLNFRQQASQGVALECGGNGDEGIHRRISLREQPVAPLFDPSMSARRGNLPRAHGFDAIAKYRTGIRRIFEPLGEVAQLAVAGATRFHSCEQFDLVVPAVGQLDLLPLPHRQ